MSDYRLVLGLEIHMHVKTATGMFCGCSSDIYGVEPNTRVCPVCLGLPGALPVANGDAVKKTQLLGLALGCKLNEFSRFDRKHYFYPDLPKGYQISQADYPLCEDGYIELSDGKKIFLERIHLEEDAAKSFHNGDETLIDFNKSGAALMELVTTPSIRSAKDAADLGRQLRDLVRYLGVSDADMEKGQLRVEPNISLRTAEMEENNVLPDYKVEVKNINSFKFMEKAVKFEIARQTKILEEGRTVVQENRGWDNKRQITVGQRTKEEAHDYRYFPDPDLPPMYFDAEHFAQLKAQLPQLPSAIKERFIKDYKITEQNALRLTSGGDIQEKVAKFEELAKAIDVASANDIANLFLNKKEFENLSTEEFKQKMVEMGDKVDDSEELSKIITEVLEKNPDAVEKYKAGKTNVLQFLLGQVMRETKGKAEYKTTLNLLQRQLN